MTQLMTPSLFLSHGSPMHALLDTQASRGWAALAQRLPRPRAILMASAHWETELPMLSTAERPDTIYDFRGFPPELSRLRYTAPGAPAMAQHAAALMRTAGLQVSTNGCRGLDHGAWVPLLHMYPAADIPVAQISVQPSLDAEHHMRVGAALEPLADEGVLVIGSGHMTHNLHEAFSGVRSGRAQFGTATKAAPYVDAFRQWVNEALLRQDRAALAAYAEQAPHAQRAHPSEEHFLPLLVAYAAAGPDAQIEHVDLGIEAEVLAMDAYIFWRGKEASARTHA